MRLHFLAACVLLPLLLTASLGAEEWTPGPHVGLPSTGAPERTFDVFIPQTYAQEPETKFPVLFISGPSGSPGFRGLEAWADSARTILVAINSSRNGPGDNNIAAQEAMLATLEPTLRMNPSLRFATGMSGAAQASWLLALNHPDQIAGILMEGQSGFDEMIAKHIPVAYVAGFEEPNWPYINRAAQTLRKQGNPVRIERTPGGHVEGDVALKQKLLVWLQVQALFCHPKLSTIERRAAIAKLCKEASAGTDQAQVKARCEELLAIPALAQIQEGKDLAEAWSAAAFAVATARSDASERCLRLMELQQHPRFKNQKKLPKEVADAIKDLKKDAQVTKECQLFDQLNRIRIAEAQIAGKAPQLKEALAAYRAFAEKNAGHAVAVLSQEDVVRVEADLAGVQ